MLQSLLICARCVQLSEKEAELLKVQTTNDTLRSEKDALQNDALALSDRQMQLAHANRMLTNELQQQQRGLGMASNGKDSPAELSELSSPLPEPSAGPQPPPSARHQEKNGADVADAGGNKRQGIGSKGGKATAGTGSANEVLRKAKAKRHVVDIREYEDVVGELAHRKVEIAFARVCVQPLLLQVCLLCLNSKLPCLFRWLQWWLNICWQSRIGDVLG
jgi:hypothetical protein